VTDGRCVDDELLHDDAHDHDDNRAARGTTHHAGRRAHTSEPEPTHDYDDDQEEEPAEETPEEPEETPEPTTPTPLPTTTPDDEPDSMSLPDNSSDNDDDLGTTTALVGAAGQARV
jgi:hypothetical protein